MRLIGQAETECDIGRLSADSSQRFTKTHEMAAADNFPAVVLVRDGRDAVVSYAYFVLKVERGIERPTQNQFESALEEIIGVDRFGGWSSNVKNWLDRPGCKCVIRYEDLIEDPVNITAAALARLGVDHRQDAATVPSFAALHAAVPWFFRSARARSGRQEMPVFLQELFLKKHGDTLLRLGYPTS